MPDWSALRRRAYATHLRLRTFGSLSNEPLLSAEALLSAAAGETGLVCLPVPASDPLLSGADAVLDRESGCIWYALGRNVPADRQRFARAHEFAHFWLHPQIVRDNCFTSTEVATYLPDSDSSPSIQIETGYSPQERRETEANLFAAELLLPAPILLRLFLQEGWRADRIAAVSGLSESCVLAQLTHSLLLPPLYSEDRVEGENRFDAIENRKSKIENPLDSSQQTAAVIERGPVLVDAGPGTGKTRTLVARIRHLLEERRIPPESILALTFSRKAAEEMQTRLRDYVGETAERVWIGTFHAFGLELLRKEGSALGLPVRPRLVETADAVALLERHLDRLKLNEFAYLSQPILPFPDILSCIRRAKDELKTPADYRAMALRQMATADEKEMAAARKSVEIAHIYEVYQKLLQEHGLLDFSDLIMRSVVLLETVPAVLERWQTRFPHIVADEYQDINRASSRLLQLLAGDGAGFWAVGDLRQAIYRFIGASPANIEQFERDFPGGQRLRLDRNYRSRPSLVSLFSQTAQQTFSSSVPSQDSITTVPDYKRTADRHEENAQQIENRNSKIENPLWHPHRDSTGDPEISVVVTEDEEGQADWLAAQIRSWEAAGVPLSQQAILVAVNRHASELADQLEARSIPVQHFGGLFERVEVKDMLALLSLACEPEGTALARVAAFPEYAIPAADVACLLKQAREAGAFFPEALSLASSLPELSEPGRQGIARLYSQLKPLLYHGDAWLLASRYLFQASDYLIPLLKAAPHSITARQKLLALYQFLQFAQSQSKRLSAEEGMQAQTAFLNHLRFLLMCGEARITRLPPEADSLNGVRLMTVHQSKGLEFPIVYLPNLVKGQFPARGRSSMAALPPELEQNENGGDDCLFFVALSRARDHLALCCPSTWNGKPAFPSPLLEQIEEALAACNAQRINWTAELHTKSPDLPNTRQHQDPDGDSESVLQPVRLPSGQSDSVTEDSSAPSSTPFSTPATPSVLSVSALEQYLQCPRQFYYQRVAQLPDRGTESAYLAFHDSLQSTLSWLQEQRSNGRQPAQEEAEAHFQSRWNQRRPAEKTAHTTVLEQQARHLLKASYHPAVETASQQPGIELTAALPHGKVKLRCDQTEQRPDGTLRLTRQIHRKAKKEDANEERLALLRIAAQQNHPNRPIEIALHYVPEGKIEVVPEKPRFEPNRVKKYDIALQEIKQRRFEPRPGDRQCAQCPYHFICPV